MRYRVFIPLLFLLVPLVLVFAGTDAVLARFPGQYRPNDKHDYYFLFAWKMRKTPGKPSGNMLVLDNKGTIVFFRKMDCASDFKLHPGGEISYWDGKKHILCDQYFRVRDSVSCVNGIETDSHDFVVLPDGHFLLIGMEACDTNLSMHHVFMQKDLPGSKNAKMKIGVVQELDQNKKLVYEWKARPYYRIDDADKIYLNDTTVIDITHFNSVEQDKDGNIIVSARYSNELIKIRRSDGKLIWRLGGKYNEFKFIGDTIPFLGQHDARIQADGALTLFDNGYAAEKNQHGVRALEYVLDEKNKTATLKWSNMFDPKIISEATGNMQRVYDGTTLINFGRVKNGNPNLTCVRVNNEGEPLMALTFADTMGSYRSFVYPKIPVELNRPKVTVHRSGKNIELRAESSGGTISWTNGITGNSITVSAPGNYAACIPYGDGWIWSEPVLVTKDMLEGK